MNVVFVGIGFVDFNFWVAPLDGSHYDAQIIPHAALENFPTVSGRQYQMVAGVVNGVGLSAKQHASTLARQRTGYTPELPLGVLRLR